MRAGYTPWCVDLFADADLTARCRASASDRYPEGLFDLARGLPDAPWMYTGGLENYPDLIDDLGAERPLLGNDGDLLREVRNPFVMIESLRSAGVHVPACRSPPEGLPRVGSLGHFDAGPAGREVFNRLGAFLAERFLLRGIFGVDVVLADERLWSIEV